MNLSLAAMIQFLMILGVTLLIIGATIALFNIRYFFTGEPFRGSCAQNNPLLKSKIGDCQVCGKKADEVCKMPEVH